MTEFLLITYSWLCKRWALENTPAGIQVPAGIRLAIPGVRTSPQTPQTHFLHSFVMLLCAVVHHMTIPRTQPSTLFLTVSWTLNELPWTAYNWTMLLSEQFSKQCQHILGLGCEVHTLRYKPTARCNNIAVEMRCYSWEENFQDIRVQRNKQD